MASDPATFSATELLQLYRTKQLSPVEATAAALARIERFEPAVNAFCLVDAEAALAAARAAEVRWQKGQPLGLLDGVPTTIKDIVLTKGWPTLRGSRAIARDQAWAEDAPATARLRAHGAVLLGKTTTPEFGWKAVTDSALTGITRNPWDTGKTPGGSSGGAAVACALGMGALHVGTDGGGSIRIPAGFTGIFGLKPSFGRVPAAPASPFGTLAHLGPMTRSVADAALMLTVLAEPDARDWFALPYDQRDYRIGLEQGLHGLRVAFSPTLGGAVVEPEIAALVATAVDLLAELGAAVELAEPELGDTLGPFMTLWSAGAAHMLSRYSAAQQAGMDPGLLELADAGRALSLADYQRAQDLRAAIGTTLRQFHERYDVLVTPTLPIAAFAAGCERPEPERQPRWSHWTPFSYPFNLSQQPAASVPCGLTRAGLPAGLQIVGPMHGDALVLRVARALEAVLPWPMPEAPRVSQA